MTHIMQRVGALCAAAALFCFSAVAVAKPLTIGMSFQEMNNAYFVTMKQALDQAAGEINAQVITADARHDVSKQINDIEDMLQKKIDILLINPADSVGVESAVNEAKKAGVVVIAIDAQAQGPIDAFVGSKNYDAGFKSGEYLAKALGGKGKVAILDGIPVVPILERVKGFEAAMKKYPDIEIVTKQNGRQERDTAMTVTENMLQGNPDLAGLFSVNDVGALGALSAIQANGASIKLVSVDGHPEAIKEIMKPNSPFIATSAQYPRDMVRLGIGVALAKHWGSQVPKTVPLDVKLITKDNGKDFSW